MKKTARLFGAYLPILLVILPAAVVLRTVACFKDMTGSGYFGSKIVITAANALIFALVIFMLTYLAIAKKDVKLVNRPHSPLNFISCTIICAALLFVAIYAVILSVPELKLYIHIHPEDKNPKMLIAPLITLFTGITAILAIPYFVVSALWAKGKSVIISNLGLFPLVFLCFMVASIYFDGASAFNMPSKIISQMAYLAAAVFFLYEIRLPLGREKWRAYICFGMICTALCAYSAIPALIVYLARPDTLHLLATSEFEIILTLSIFIFCALKLILTATLIEDKESAITQRVRQFSLERTTRLEPEQIDETTASEQTEEEKTEATEATNTADEQIENQESFFGDFNEQKDTEQETEDITSSDDALSELEEISEARRLELSANNIKTDENEKDIDN